MGTTDSHVEEFELDLRVGQQQAEHASASLNERRVHRHHARLLAVHGAEAPIVLQGERRRGSPPAAFLSAGPVRLTAGETPIHAAGGCEPTDLYPRRTDERSSPR